jgi:CDP-2,3-bis-(O-geranylgeranyl)-sn-glycerol synthase
LNVFEAFFFAFIFMIPAMFANTVPVYINGLGAIDRGKLFYDGRPILGKNKTVGGLLSATLAGGLAGISTFFFFPTISGQFPIWIGFIMGFAAMVGDASGSFVKRRVNLRPGGPFPIMDQIGFIAFAFIFCYPFARYPLEWPLVLIPSMLFLHIFANYFAFKMGWKEVWW